ncbi:hypothetical protein FB45DRAFT_1138887 [Roridomyces roridus]|uniref:Uncharacterized protein n=1 Tax=Roridomyces roridus TaxID=1738132 RepID=A0AAD7C1Y7_9AGAR|nr:hypothetical protein FB45DRAFT_1138887 [Roridomyces roridus]
MESHWSNVPAELIHEITSYNADDIPTLRAMSLVSKMTRPFATIHLFSAIHFSCVEDFPWWLEMLNRTPALATIVTKVKFSGGCSQRSMDRLGLTSVTQLSDSSSIPVLPSLPNVTSVHLVEWRNGSTPMAMLMTQMALCPHIRELHLFRVTFYCYSELVAIIGAGGKALRSLSFNRVTLKMCYHFHFSWQSVCDSDEPDLSTLEQLSVERCSFSCTLGFQDCIGRLMKEYRPTGVRTLILGYTNEDDIQACSISDAETLLRLNAPSVVNLIMDPALDIYDSEIMRMFETLPAFQALETLTIWLHPDRMAQRLIDALKGAPNLTRLVLRMPLNDYWGYEEDREEFNRIVKKVFPWGPGQDSMKTVVLRKFPLCREIAFHLCVPRKSVIHFRRGVRRRMELQLKERLEKTRADIAAYLRIEWLDEDFRFVVYRKTNGKPLWEFNRVGRNGSRESEPETEDSDCDSESESESESEYDE